MRYFSDNNNAISLLFIRLFRDSSSHVSVRDKEYIGRNPNQ